MINPKYVIKFNKENRIFWRFNEENTIIKSFGIIIADQIKWFEGDQTQLTELKLAIGNRIFFGNISLFYDSITVIGSGASCKVSGIIIHLGMLSGETK